MIIDLIAQELRTTGIRGPGYLAYANGETGSFSG
jgi:hypothetical protein